MKKLIFSFLIVGSLNSEAQTVRQPLAVRYAGLGAYSTQFVDVFSGSSNQAALAQIKTAGLGAYTERRFYCKNSISILQLLHYLQVLELLPFREIILVLVVIMNLN